jgi:hypothetical protein
LSQTANNVYHALFHGVPAFEGLARHTRNGSSAAAAFFPLLSNSAGVGRKVSASARWHAWELLVRSLTPDSADAIAAALDTLLHTPCTCFAEVHGATGPFVPSAPSSADRLRTWRHAVLLHARRSLAVPIVPAVAFPAPRDELATILYIRRTGATRVVVNEAQLASGLASSAVTRVLLLDLGALTLSQQLAHVATAHALVGVHGQALAFLPFLAADASPGADLPRTLARSKSNGGRTRDAASRRACLELLPPPVDGARCHDGHLCETNPFKHTYQEHVLPGPNHALRSCVLLLSHGLCPSEPRCVRPHSIACVHRLSQVMGVEYLALVTSLAPPCTQRALRTASLQLRLRCNLSVPREGFARRMRTVRAIVRGGG